MKGQLPTETLRFRLELESANKFRHPQAHRSAPSTTLVADTNLQLVSGVLPRLTPRDPDTVRLKPPATYSCVTKLSSMFTALPLWSYWYTFKIA